MFLFEATFGDQFMFGNRFMFLLDEALCLSDLKDGKQMPGIILVTVYVRKCLRHWGYTSGHVITLQGTESLEGNADSNISDSNPLLRGDESCCDGTNRKLWILYPV